jgi:GH35 family endo-1,4-beta-xylanase
VVDAAGKPIPNATVKVAQTRSLFRWGTAAPAGRLVDTQNPDDLRFQQQVKRLFNTVVLESDLKWQNADGNPQDVATAEQAIDWLHANGIQVRGHNLVWGSWQFSPAWLKDQTPAEETRAVEARVRGFAHRFRGKVYIWDVVNEATNENDLWKKIGWENFANAYKWAHEEDPNALLAYNDYHAFDGPDSPGSKGEREHIQYLIDQQAPLDVLGEQAHLGTPLIPIGTVLQRLDALAQFGKRIEITEFDLGVQDDQMHGQYVRDFLIAAFSHPQVDGVIQWGFWEGSHWRAKEGAALFRRDWTPRPAATAFEDLVLHQWRTNAQGKTGQQGNYAVRGFLGDYAVTVSAHGRTKTVQTSLPKAGQALKVTLP